MEKVKPFEIIAEEYQVSRESAKYFLGRVQKSFKVEKPPQQLIVDFMAKQDFDTLPEPHLVAKLMNESGIWGAALHTEPATLTDEPDLYF